MTHSLSVADKILAALETDGYLTIPHYFDPIETDAIKKEADALIEESGSWYKKEASDHGVILTISPAKAKASGQIEKISATMKACTNKTFLQVSQKYLPEGSYIDRIIFHKELPHPEPLTEWHADQHKEGRLSVKFMLYLNDVSSQNGAFSYVPGSHKLVMKLVEQARLTNTPYRQIHHYEQIRAQTEDSLSKEFDEKLQEMAAHIQGDYRSDDFYSIAAPRGSIIFFDTKGIHRGGIVREGERYILRVHYFEPEKIPLKNRIKGRLKSLLRPILAKTNN